MNRMSHLVFKLERSLAQEPDRPATTAGNAELLAELQRRSAAYRDGKTTAHSAADVMADLGKIASGEQSV
ncbi:addiction module protein [bacterium]|nr:addiction module protein [bacterium]